MLLLLCLCASNGCHSDPRLIPLVQLQVSKLLVTVEVEKLTWDGLSCFLESPGMCSTALIYLLDFLQPLQNASAMSCLVTSSKSLKCAEASSNCPSSFKISF